MPQTQKKIPQKQTDPR